MPEIKRISRGDGLGTILSASFQNDILSRLEKLEKLSVIAPLNLEKGVNGDALALMQRIDNFELVKLISELPASGTTLAEPLKYTTNGKSTVFSTLLTLTVTDIFGMSSGAETVGIAFKHPKGADSEPVWVFLPGPAYDGQIDDLSAIWLSENTPENADVADLSIGYELIDVNENIVRISDPVFFDFDGVDAHFELSSTVTISNVINQLMGFTIWGSVNFDSTASDQTIISIGQIDVTPDIEIKLENVANKLEAALTDEDDVTTTLTHDLVINSDTTYYWWLTWQPCSGIAKFWVGDIFGNSKILQEATGIPALKNNADQLLRVGRSVDSTSNNYLNGQMDQLMIQQVEKPVESLCKRYNGGDVITFFNPPSVGGASGGGGGGGTPTVSAWKSANVSVDLGSDWNLLVNAKFIDTTYANCGITSGIKSEIQFTDWFFNTVVPEGSIITGIEVQIRGNADLDNVLDDTSVKINLNSIDGDEHSKGEFWGTTDESKIYGSSTDLWSLAEPTITQLDEMVVKYITSNVGFSASNNIDAVRARVHYT